MTDAYTVQKVLKILGADVSRHTLIRAENSGQIPAASRSGKSDRRAWTAAQLPKIGEKFGFLTERLDKATTICVFTTKGGVLKSTIALNIARLVAMHNIKVCIVGLDMQCDITNDLGYEVDIDDDDTLESALSKMDSVYGLYDLFEKSVALNDIVVQTDLPTLSFIPETADLVALDKAIASATRRDFWLRDNVVEPLKKKFDVVIIDCPSNWNQLICNALTSCDLLISPLECKIKNFRNFKAFRSFIGNFREEAKLQFQHIYVPTKYMAARKLAKEILAYFQSSVGCTSVAIRESLQGEESMAKNISLPEYSPNSLAANEMREMVSEVWKHVIDLANAKSGSIKGTVSRDRPLTAESRA